MKNLFYLFPVLFAAYFFVDVDNVYNEDTKDIIKNLFENKYKIIEHSKVMNDIFLRNYIFLLTYIILCDKQEFLILGQFLGRKTIFKQWNYLPALSGL